MINRTSLFTLFLILSGCVQFDDNGDVISNKYASFKEASKARVFESGWLPRALPVSAANIIETHNVDNNEIWLRFSYSGNDIDRLTQTCIPTYKVQLPNTKRTKRDVAWWPKELLDSGDEKNIKRLIIFSCPKMQHASSIYPANVAIEAEIHTAWYWVVKK